MQIQEFYRQIIELCLKKWFFLLQLESRNDPKIKENAEIDSVLGWKRIMNIHEITSCCCSSRNSLRPLPTAVEAEWWWWWWPLVAAVEAAKVAAMPCARPLLRQEVELFIRELSRLPWLLTTAEAGGGSPWPPPLALEDDPLLELLLEVGLEIGGWRTPEPTLFVPEELRDLT